MEFLETKQTLNLDTLKDKTSVDDEVTNIVAGLGKIQIGDSFFTQKKTPLEENVKEAVDTLHCIINDSSKSTETVFIDGQGDTNIKTVPEAPIVDKIISAEAFRFRNEVSSNLEKEAIVDSSTFLRRVIQEMEEQVPNKVIDPIVKEEIANWEEQEEKLIRIIDGPNIDNNTDIDPEDNEEEENEVLIQEEIGEMNFLGQEPKISSLLSNASSSSSKPQYVIEEIVIEEVGSFPLSPDIEEPKGLPPPPTKLPLPPIPGGGSELESKDNCKAHKSGKAKKWLGNKFRKLFYFAFGRNKH